MHTRTVLTIFAAALAAPAALAQTIGIGATSTAYTAQASAAIAKVVSEKAGIQMRVQTHGGTSVYVPLLNAGNLEFGLANELETLYAATGQEIYQGRPQKDLRVATVLTPFASGLYARKDSNIRSVKDLKGKRVPAGWASQKIIGVLMDGVLANAGMTYADVEQVPVPNVVKGADDFAAGKTDVFFFAVGAGKVKETDAKVGGIRAIPIDPSPEAVARMKKHVPPAEAKLYKPSPVNVGVLEPTHIMAYDYMMLTNAKVSDDVVYRVLKAMHDNKKDLAASFPALNQFAPDRMAKNIPGVAVHPGAIRLYKETGQWPPK
ncbi:MAG TPA: TAXI family TRAP transporter solute-binding subunit [Burkholderiales bacterium]|nr:TAXI family TRAP transporter solute-binding subunit [Burkholderiales bacterium]